MPSGQDQPRDEKGRWVKGSTAGTVVGAAVVAGLVATASGAGTSASIGSALDAGASARSGSGNTAKSRDAAGRGDRLTAWERAGLKEIKRQVTHQLRCGVQSTGAVQRYFLGHPCDKLDQLLFLVSDGQGNDILGSVVWVTMPSTASAAEFKSIEDVGGSGDVTPFGTEALALGGIKFTGMHYASRSDGRLVVVAETEPVHGSPSDALLKDVATIADLLPPL
ncbi:hypothetical protein GCM10010174_38020 [Kutzneria viridogrisea]|uniref:Secreted protein n=1 Tax=Kutzneria viridogrisea TaxID=47990 RepID=A0ABR6BYK9_9PSEU|nr:hypothetical protein [Kutzneria viridogrisea]